MKKKVNLFLKGMILGAAMIVPGLSGGTLAISMGLYEKIIKTISHFFSDFKNNFKFALNLGLGAAVSIAICIFALDYVFENFPVPAILFFVGLIVGSIPAMFEEVNFKKNAKPKNLIFLLIGALIIIGVSLLNGDTSQVVLGEPNLIQSIKLVGVGVIAAGTIVIPGISGSLLLMVIGYYTPILSVISELMKFQNIMQNILILLPLGVGIIGGGFLIVKMIEQLFKRYKVKTYFAIIGFLLASIIQVTFNLFQYKTNYIQIVVGIILLVGGAYLTLKLEKND